MVSTLIFQGWENVVSDIYSEIFLITWTSCCRRYFESKFNHIAEAVFEFSL